MAVAKVILNGNTLIDTTDKTVTSGGMLSGVTALKNDGTSITGSIASQAAQTIHPSATDQTIASGKYLTGTQTVKGVLLTNLSAGNIKKDVVVKVGDSTDDDCVASVTGTYEGGGGGGVTPAPKKQINFIDYDGTILYSYTKAEINAMTSESDLPANPSHTGLTAQGWNWTLTQIKSQLTAMPDGEVWVGQMYVTESGDTEIDVELHAPRLSPYLGLATDGTVEVDWGDGTAKSTVSGTSLSTQIRTLHNYSTEGSYTIKIHKVSGSYTLYGNSTYGIFSGNYSSGNKNRVYTNAVKSVRIGSGVTSIGYYTFYNCYSLSFVTIPNGVTNISASTFYYCYSLASIVVPSNVTSLDSYAFSDCYSLSSIAIPNSVTTIDSYAFNNCYSLESIGIPSNVATIGTYAFYYCYSLPSITIPNGITTIAGNTFCYCYSLASIVVPSNVTSLGSGAVRNCYGVGSVHFKRSTPPSIASNTFQNLPTDCIIYVPSGKLSDYTGASNYPSSSTYTYVEE